MKHPAIIFVIAALLAGCSKPASPTDTSTPETTAITTAPADYPTLVIDEQHMMRGKETPPPYQIATAAGIRLDATQFHFTYGTNDLTPNMVQVVADKTVYRFSRPTETNLYMIDRTTMEGVRGEIFRGFRSGSHIMLFIGRSTRGPEKEDFWVSWAGQIEVK